MIDIQLENKIIKALVSVNRKPSDHSLSEAIKSLKSNQLDFDNDFLVNIDEVYPTILTEKTNTAIKMGVSNPYERKTAMETLASIDPGAFNQDKGQHLVSFNKKLKDFGVSYQYPVGLVGQLPSFAQRAISIQTAIKNIRLLIKKNMTDAIYPLVEKYEQLNIGSLRDKFNEYNTILDTIVNNAADPEKMYEMASQVLMKNGYPEIAVKGKDPGALSNSIFNEMVAAKGVLKSLEDKEKTGQPSNVYDNIAVILITLLK